MAFSSRFAFWEQKGSEAPLVKDEESSPLALKQPATAVTAATTIPNGAGFIKKAVRSKEEQMKLEQPSSPVSQPPSPGWRPPSRVLSPPLQPPFVMNGGSNRVRKISQGSSDGPPGIYANGQPGSHIGSPPPGLTSPTDSAATTADDPGLRGVVKKKVIKVVRRVVRKPRSPDAEMQDGGKPDAPSGAPAIGNDAGLTALPPPPPPPSCNTAGGRSPAASMTVEVTKLAERPPRSDGVVAKHGPVAPAAPATSAAPAAVVNGKPDAISEGLASLMSRAKTKEPRLRVRRVVERRGEEAATAVAPSPSPQPPGEEGKAEVAPSRPGGPVPAIDETAQGDRRDASDTRDAVICSVPSALVASEPVRQEMTFPLPTQENKPASEAPKVELEPVLAITEQPTPSHEPLQQQQQPPLPPPSPQPEKMEAKASPELPRTEEEQQQQGFYAWFEGEKVWLVRKDGFVAATELKPDVGTPEMPARRLKLKMEERGTIVDVDEEEVEKANPAELEQAEQLASLLFLNESSLLHTLRSRLAHAKPYTYAGTHLLALAPARGAPLHTDEAMRAVRCCHGEAPPPPHIYSAARAAFRRMLGSRQDQTLLFLGAAGAGKTTAARHAAEYLATFAAHGGPGAGPPGSLAGARPSGGRNVVEPCKNIGGRLRAAFTVLESFGHTSTATAAMTGGGDGGGGGGSSRFAQLLSLDFNQSGRLAAASVQTMLLDRLCVVHRAEGERPFKVFQQLMAGADAALRTELYMGTFAEMNAFGITPLTKPEERQAAASEFSGLLSAMKTLGFDEKEQRGLWLVLAAIYHLGAAGATKVGRKQFARHESAQKVAYLLGCTLDELSTATFKHHLRNIGLGPCGGGGGRHSSVGAHGCLDETSLDSTPGPKLTALECLQGMAMGLYGEVFNLVVSLINRSMSSSQHTLSSVLLVDAPGFRTSGAAGQGRPAGSLSDLVHNYAQERLQLLFHERALAAPLERLREENIAVAVEEEPPSCAPSVSAVDAASQAAQILGSGRSSVGASGGDRRGLLWLLDEAAATPGATDDDLVEKFVAAFGPRDDGHTADDAAAAVHKEDQPCCFSVWHALGALPVRYDAGGWVAHAKHNPSVHNAATLLQDSQKAALSEPFAPSAGALRVLGGAIAGLDGPSQSASRRAASVRRCLSTGGTGGRRRSLAAHVKLQVDALLDMVRKTYVHFVFCLRPSAALGVSGAAAVDIPFLRAQARACQLVDALRLHRQGYPDQMSFSEFRRGFEVLAPQLCKKHGRQYIATDDRRAAEELLEALDLERSTYAVGVSQVVFKAGVLASLEYLRDSQICETIVNFQALCRGKIVRQWIQKRKVQDLAVRCLQRNFRAMESVRQWHWWRAFTLVRPLVPPAASEEPAKYKEEEMAQLRGRLEKSEKDRHELRQGSDRLESKVTELQTELTDERRLSETTAQLLDVEVSERLRVEKELREVQVRFEELKKRTAAVEMEVSEARMLRATEASSGMDGADGGEWKSRYERAMRENGYARKKLQQEMEDKVEVEQQQKKQLDLKVTELQSSGEEAQRSLQNLQRRCQRLGAELQDCRLHMETHQARNHELDKKQKKFDGELAQALEEASRERSQRERLTHERDVISLEISSLNQQLEDKVFDITMLNEKVAQLENELLDVTTQGSHDEGSLASLRKQIRDLEAKVNDQEEELDDQAGKIQLLEQNKLRNEMEMQRMKQIHQKEVENKEDEVEDVRQTCQKRLRHLEHQLEEDHEDKQKLVMQKRDLESKLALLGEQVGQRDFELEKRLRRDLRRTKALLADAQTMLEHLKESAPSRREIAQLKNQLEESEFACAAAVKARKVLEAEVEDLHHQLEEMMRSKVALEEQMVRLQREKTDLQGRVDEDQEDLDELIKKHKALVAQSSTDLAHINELEVNLGDAAREKEEMEEKVQVLQARVAFLEQSMVERCIVSRQEGRIRDLESKLEFEKLQIKRYEALALRLKENIDRVSSERDERGASEGREREQNKRLQRQIRDVKEEAAELAKREGESNRKRHELELDMASLEAANQSLQSDLHASFQRISDLQAAMEDEMASDENDEAVDRVQELVAKYQRKKNKTGGDEDSDSEVEDRVDSVKSWLSKNKGSPPGDVPGGGGKTPSDEGSLKPSSKFNLDGKDAGDVRPASVMSSLSYRKRAGGQHDNKDDDDSQSLLSALSRDSAAEQASSLRKSKKASSMDDLDDVKSWRRSLPSATADDFDDDAASSVSSRPFARRPRNGTAGDKRWSLASLEKDDDAKSDFSFVPSLRRMAYDEGDDAKSGAGFGGRSSLSLPRPASAASFGDGGGVGLGYGLGRRSDFGGGASPSVGRGRPDSGALSPAPSSLRRSELGVTSALPGSRPESRSSVSSWSKGGGYGESAGRGGGGGDDDGRTSALARSLSVPPRPQSALDGGGSYRGTDATDDVKPVTHRSWLDPELEAAINEVLSYKPVKPKRRNYSAVSDDDTAAAGDADDDRMSARGAKSVQANGGGETRSSQIRRSYSAMDVNAPSSSSSIGKKKSSHGGRRSKSSQESSSSDDSDEKPAKSSKKSSSKKPKKAKKSKKSRKKDASDSSSDSSSDSTSSTVSYKSVDSVKKGPAATRRGSAGDEGDGDGGGNAEDKGRADKRKVKEEKKRKKEVDSLMMKYLYRPDSD
ncbi:unconventional myosin-XVIIIa-like isoform X2 [Petromyzon marinus]|uniref:unconventional myosin-XVIIIa-like isoform X2 n=1 Tax=Petromyzon marinus TaxID=7757 RepID=UPI003F6F121A